MCKKDWFFWKPNISLLFNLINNPSTKSVADPGEGPAPPLFLDQSEARRAEKNFFKTSHPPPSPRLSQGLDDHTPSLSEGPDGYSNTGPEQSMKIDDRKINRSIDDNQLITVD